MELRFEHYSDDDGNDLIERELLKLPMFERGRLYLKLDDIETNGLTPKNHKFFKGYTIPFGEFIAGDFRILMHQTADDAFVLLHLFRKQSNKTPQREIEIGWKRLITYLSRQHYGSA